MRCPHCGREVSDNAQVCGHCGQWLVAAVRCPHCGAELPAQARVCGYCGQPLGVPAAPSRPVRLPGWALAAGGVLVVLAIVLAVALIVLVALPSRAEPTPSIVVARPTVRPATATPLVPTPRPTPTDTPTPTSTPAPTKVPTLTPTPTPTPKPVAVVQAEAANVRGGPGTEYDVVGQARQGDELEIVARTAGGDWLQIRLADGKEGWVSGQVVEVSGEITGIPVAAVIPPTPTPALIVLYSDDFSDPEGGWARQSKETMEVRYEEGEYVILVKKEATFVSTWRSKETFADFTLEADARQVEGPEGAGFGLTFRRVDLDNFYRFEISGYGTYIVEKQVNGKWQNVGGMKWTPSPHIKTGGATNHLKVVCKGPQIALYVNGQHLTTVSDDSFAEGKVGLIAGTAKGSSPVKVAFDNLVVSEAEAIP